MVFSYVPPSPGLKEFVRDYLVAHFVFDGGAPAPFKSYAPKPEQGITFFPRGGPSAVNPATGGCTGAPPVSVFGQQVARYQVSLPHEFLMVRVHLRPGALFRLLNVPLYELPQDYADAGSLLGPSVLETSERLSSARDYSEMIALVEAYLLRVVGATKQSAHPVDRVADSLTADPTRFSLDWLADQSCLCPRQFNRQFTERMGVGPKRYGRIVRFYRSCQFKGSNPDADWATVAVRFGYSDYQHMVKDFKAFTGTTPNLWMREDRASPEHVLAL